MINIFQTWTHIAVFLTTATSISRSCAAVIQVDDPDGLSLIYQYQNQPLAKAMKTMHNEFGVRFRLVESSKELHNTPLGTTQQFLYCYCKVE